jgi:hypothetical protein
MSDELGPEARDLIARACREERAPEAHELRRIRNNVVLGAAPAAVLLGAGEAAAATAKVTLVSLAGLATKGFLLGTAVAFAGYTVHGYEYRSVSAPTLVRPAPKPETSVAPPVPSEVLVSADSPTPVVPPLERPESAVIRKRSSSSVSSTPPVAHLPSSGALPDSAELREEVENLSRVQEHLRAGRGAEALRVLDASSSRLGQGQLRQERLAAEVFAACQSGDKERARSAARRFLMENPATPSAARLKTSCVGEEIDLD